MRSPFAIRALALAVLGVCAGLAAETVVLRNGYELRAQGHLRDGAQIRLQRPNGGWIVLSAGSVAEIVADGSRRDGAIAAGVRATEAPRGDGGERRPPTDAEQAVERFSAEAGIPAGLVRAMIWAESGFDERARSPKGAVGPMQLMPGTADELGVDPLDAVANIRGGTEYLKRLLERYAGETDQLVRALAAYNAGPGRVAQHGGTPPYPETEAYVAKVLRRFLASPPAPGSPPGID